MGAEWAVVWVFVQNEQTAKVWSEPRFRLSHGLILTQWGKGGLFMQAVWGSTISNCQLSDVVPSIGPYVIVGQSNDVGQRKKRNRKLLKRYQMKHSGDHRS